MKTTKKEEEREGKMRYEAHGTPNGIVKKVVRREKRNFKRL